MGPQVGVRMSLGREWQNTEAKQGRENIGENFDCRGADTEEKERKEGK